MIETGTLIHGTLRTEDLLAAFADELERRGKNEAATMANANGSDFAAWLDKQNHRDKLITDARTVDPNHEEAAEIVNELADELNTYAPEGFYFGAHEGDGSDFGFWKISQ